MARWVGRRGQRPRRGDRGAAESGTATGVRVDHGPADDPRSRSRNLSATGGRSPDRHERPFIEAGIDLAANAQGTIAAPRVRKLAHGRTPKPSSRPSAGPPGLGGAQTIATPKRRTTVTGKVVALDSRGTAYAAYKRGAAAVVRLATCGRGASGPVECPADLAAARRPPGHRRHPPTHRHVAWRRSERLRGNGIQSGLLDSRSAGRRRAQRLARLSAARIRNYRLASRRAARRWFDWVPRRPTRRDSPTRRDRPAGRSVPSTWSPASTPLGDFHGGPRRWATTPPRRPRRRLRVRVIARPPARRSTRSPS